MTIENNKITFIAETDYDNLFIPKNVDGIIDDEYAIGFAAITPKTITVEEGNPAFFVQNNCLIERATKTLVVAGENAIIPDDGSVEIINDFAFNGNRTLAREFVIPEGVTEIGFMAFKDTNVEKFVVPASVEFIDNMAFWCYEKTLKEIVVDKNNLRYFVESNCLIYREDDMVVVISIVDRNVREVVIPQGVKTIGEGVFFLSDFEKVYLPSTLLHIHTNNFDLKEGRKIGCKENAYFFQFCERNHIVFGGEEW